MDSGTEYKVFSTLSQWIKEGNKTIDPLLNTEIYDEYQYGNFILISTILHNKHQDNEYLKFNENILQYISSKTFHSPLYREFNLEALCISYEIFKTKNILDAIFSLENSSNEVLNKYKAIDFTIAKLFTINYKLNNLKNQHSLSFIKKKINNYFGKDGIIYDSKNNNNIGIPDLVYHCRNLELLTADVFWNNNLTFLNQVKSAFEFILNLMCDDGYFGYYGRSNDSLYGISSLLTSFSYATLLFPNEKNLFKDKYDLVKEILISDYFDSKNNCFFVFPNSTNKKILFTDDYIHVLVYNYFAFSRYLLSSHIVNNARLYKFQNEELKINFNIKKKNIVVFDDSCFVKLNSKIQAVFNYRGHYDSSFIKNDNRYSPLSLIRLVYERKNHIPLLVSSRNSYNGKYYKCKNLFSNFRDYFYSKYRQIIIPGYTPIIRKNNRWYKPVVGKIESKKDGMLKLQYEFCMVDSFIDNLLKSFFSSKNNNEDRIVLNQTIFINDNICIKYETLDDCELFFSVMQDNNCSISLLENQIIINQKLSFRFTKKINIYRRRYLLNSNGIINNLLLKIDSKNENNFSLIIDAI